MSYQQSLAEADARRLMAEQTRRIKQRQASLLERSFAFEHPAASRFRNVIQGKVHPTFRKQFAQFC